MTVFGTAGNSGTVGDYGTTAMTDTIQVTAGQQISVTYNLTNFGQASTWEVPSPKRSGQPRE